MWMWDSRMVGWVKSLGGILGVAGSPEREGEAEEWGSGEVTVVVAGGLLAENGEPPIVALSEMMLLVPMLSGWEVVERRARGWTRLCSPKVRGWLPRIYAPGSRWVVAGRVTIGRLDAVAELFGFEVDIAVNTVEWAQVEVRKWKNVWRRRSLGRGR